MKRLHTRIFWVSMLSLLLFFTASAVHAAVYCGNASIMRIGTNPAVASNSSSPYMVQLDCADDDVWPNGVQFYLSAGLGDSGLATVLTAYSLGKNLWVEAADKTKGSLVTWILIND